MIGVFVKEAAKAFFSEETLQRIAGVYKMRPSVEFVQIATMDNGAVLRADKSIKYNPAKDMRCIASHRTIAAFVAAILAAWCSHAAALDRVGAIEVAKRQAGSKCSSASPCTFDAKLENDKWYVRVQFTRAEPPQGKPPAKAGSHAIFIINQSGKVVGRIEGQ
jgi:hypothetical protein